MLSATAKIQVGFSIALVCALGALALSYRTTTRLIDSNNLAVRATGALTELQGILAGLNNIEESRLAWVAAGTAMHNLRVRRSRESACGLCHSPQTRPVEAERFRDTHLAMVSDLSRHLQGLRPLAVLDPSQPQKLGLLESLVQAKAALAKQGIPPENIAGFSEQQSAVLQQETHLTRQIEEIVAGMERAEGQVLTRQSGARAATVRNEIFAVSLLGFLTLCAAVVAYAVLHRDLARRQVLERELLRSLQVKEALLKEVHHRVKNNLQVICSLLSLQTSTVADEHTRNVLWEAEARVRSMALVHDKLYRSGDPVNIDLTDYIQTLSHQLLEVYGSPLRHIQLTMSRSTVHLDLDRAMLCGMIVNELLTNAFRHAFPHRGEGEVAIALEPDGSQVLLSVRDNGVGMPAEKQPGSALTLGLNLVRMLTKQLKGTLETRSGPGTEIVITFPQVAG